MEIKKLLNEIKKSQDESNKKFRELLRYLWVRFEYHGFKLHYTKSSIWYY